MRVIFHRELKKIIFSRGFVIAVLGPPLLILFFGLIMIGLSVYHVYRDSQKVYPGAPAISGTLVGIVDESKILTGDFGTLRDVTANGIYKYTPQRKPTPLDALVGAVPEGSNNNLLGAFASSLSFRLFADIGFATSALDRERVGLFFVVPSEYLETGEVQYVERDGGYLKSLGHQAALKEMLAESLLLGSGVEASVITRAVDGPSFSARYSEEGELSSVPPDGDENPVVKLLKEHSNKAVTYILAFIIIWVIMSNSTRLIASINEERESKLVEVLITSVAAWQLITGKVLGILVASLCQLSIWLVFGLGIPLFLAQRFGFSISDSIQIQSLGFALLIAFFGMIFYGFFYSALGSLSRDPHEFSGMRTLGAVFQLGVVYSLILFLPNASVATWRLLSLIPFLTPILIPFQIFEADFGLSESVFYLLLMMLFAGVMGRLSAKLFRVRLMHEGQDIGEISLFLKALRFREGC